jgi:hypothetical protein
MFKIFSTNKPVLKKWKIVSIFSLLSKKPLGKIPTIFKIKVLNIENSPHIEIFH